jgi:hypothetical protein
MRPYRPKEGETLYIVGAPGFEHITGPIEVHKVGTKFFYLQRGIGAEPVPVHISSWVPKWGYSSNYQIFANEQDYQEYEESKLIANAVRTKLYIHSWPGNRKDTPSVEQLREVAAILGVGAIKKDCKILVDTPANNGIIAPTTTKRE